MPGCVHCGHENPGGAHFCLACAGPLTTDEPEAFRKVVTILFSDVVGSTSLGYEQKGNVAMSARVKITLDELRREQVAL